MSLKYSLLCYNFVYKYIGSLMSDDKRILNLISNETKKSIDQIQVVTPSVYASIFAKFASTHNAPLENEVQISADILTEQCSALTTLQTQTSKNALHLSNSTEKAISAIKNKDESKLNEVLRETQALRTEINKLKHSMYRDELTNVFNRKWLHDNCLDPESENLNNNGILSIIDLNYFKIVNDTHGHVIGDKVLVFISNELKKSGYKVIRYGGDEFIILFPQNITLGQAKSTLSKIRENVIVKKLKAHDSIFRTSFSIGLCSYTKGSSLASTIAIADKDMYEDKIEIKKRITGIEV